jgi:23S rRNA (guanosine2251-2'-O)-methyltransferase
MAEEAPIILEGAVSVEAALDSGSRRIERLLVRRGPTEPFVRALIRRCQQAGAEVEEVSEQMLADVASGRSHGGLVAYVGPRVTVPLASLLPENEAAFIVMLDGVEDPFNYGQAIRAIYAAGAHGLVTRARTWENAASVVARSSAGASERLLTAQVDSPDEAAAFFRAAGLRIAVTDNRRAVSIYDEDLTVPLFLLIGGERRGVTRSFADAADVRLQIPYGRGFSKSLGTTSAAAVLTFEVMRQRAARK